MWTPISTFINTWNVHHFFELDIDRIVGLEKVEEFRRRIESKTGKQSIPVWHSNRGWQYFVNMCKEYSYVSIGGIAKNPNGKAIEKIFPWFIQEAHRTGTQIHGLGYTDTKKLKQYPFDSVDSTSWSSGGRYGVTFELKGNAMCGKKNIYPDKKLDGQPRQPPQPQGVVTICKISRPLKGVRKPMKTYSNDNGITRMRFLDVPVTVFCPLGSELLQGVGELRD